MPRVDWDTMGTRVYETGIDRGMLYVNGGTGVAWNGLVKVSEASTGGAAREFFLDGDKFLNLAGLEEYQATIEAVSAPKEFAPCGGSALLYPGLFASNQPPQTFGFSYRTKIGDDLNGISNDYKIHIVYNVQAKASDFQRQTISKTPGFKTSTWAIVGVPEPFIDYKPSSHFVIDTRKTDYATVQGIEDILYGTDTTDPRMPRVSELMNILVTAVFDTLITMKKMRIIVTGTSKTKATTLVRMKKMRIAASSTEKSRATVSVRMKKMGIVANVKGVAKATVSARMKKMKIAFSATSPYAKKNSFEGGVNGTTVSTANSGGASGDPFDGAQTGGTGGVLAFDSTRAAHGSMSMGVATGATVVAPFVNYAFPKVPQVWSRFYMYATGVPAGNVRIFGYYDTAPATNHCGFLRFTTAQKLAIVDTSGNPTWTSTNNIPLNQWIRIEFMVLGGASNGQCQASFYAADSLTPIETSGLLTGQALNGEIASAAFGVSIGSSNIAKFWIDDVAYSTISNPGVWTAGTPIATVSVSMKKMRIVSNGTGKAVATAAVGMKKMRITASSTAKATATASVRMKKMTISATGSVSMPFTRGNTLEGGTNGTAVSAANSGGASGDAFDLVSIGSGATVAFTNAQKAHSAMAMAVATGATSTYAYAGWNVTGTKLWGRFYVYRTATETANTRAAAAYGTSPTSSPRAFIRFATGGKLVACDSASAILWTSTNAMPINQWIRIEFFMNCDAVNGQFNLSYYNTPDGMTPTESYVGATNQNLGGPLADFLFGVPIAQANVPTMYYDDMALSNTGPLGPAVTGPIGMLTDRFPGTSIDTTKWSSFGTVSVASGIVSLTNPTTQYGTSGIQALGWYDLTGGEASVQLVSAGVQRTNVESILSLQTWDNQNRVQIFCQNGSLVAQHQVNGTWGGWLNSIPYVPATHKYLRLRESGGTTYYEYSTDGFSWSVLWSETNPFPMTKVQPTIQQYNLATDPASTSQWDDFNVVLANASARMKKMRIVAQSVAGLPLLAGGAQSAAGSATRTYAITTPSEAGDTLIMVCADNNATNYPSTATDSKGNLYTLDRQTTATPGITIFRSPGATGGPTGGPTVALTTSDTFSHSNTGGTAGTMIGTLYVLPAGLVGDLDGFSASVATATGTSVSASVTPTTDRAIICLFSVYQTAGGVPAWVAPMVGIGAGYVTSSGGQYNAGGYQALGPGTAGVVQNPAITIVSATWRAVAYAFKRRTS